MNTYLISMRWKLKPSWNEWVDLLRALNGVNNKHSWGSSIVGDLTYLDCWIKAPGPTEALTIYNEILLSAKLPSFALDEPIEIKIYKEENDNG